MSRPKILSGLGRGLNHRSRTVPDLDDPGTSIMIWVHGEVVDLVHSVPPRCNCTVMGFDGHVNVNPEKVTPQFVWPESFLGRASVPETFDLLRAQVTSTGISLAIRSEAIAIVALEASN